MRRPPIRVRELALLFRASFQHHGIITAEEEEEDVLLKIKKKGGKMFFFFLDDKNHHSTLFFSFPSSYFMIILFFFSIIHSLSISCSSTIPPLTTICPNIDSPHLSLVDTHTQLCLDGGILFFSFGRSALLVHIFASHLSCVGICFADSLSLSLSRPRNTKEKEEIKIDR